MPKHADQPGGVRSLSRSPNDVGWAEVTARVGEDGPMPQPSPWFRSPDDAAARLAEHGYLADPATATTAYLAGALEKPLLT